LLIVQHNRFFLFFFIFFSPDFIEGPMGYSRGTAKSWTCSIPAAVVPLTRKSFLSASDTDDLYE
jgi:hypothetical protein